MPLTFGVSEIKIIKPMAQSLPSQLVMKQLLSDTAWTAEISPDTLPKRNENESITVVV